MCKFNHVMIMLLMNFSLYFEIFIVVCGIVLYLWTFKLNVYKIWKSFFFTILKNTSFFWDFCQNDCKPHKLYTVYLMSQTICIFLDGRVLLISSLTNNIWDVQNLIKTNSYILLTSNNKETYVVSGSRFMWSTYG